MVDKYFLAVKTRPNNYFPLNLEELKKVYLTSLEELDNFTLQYTLEDIKKFITTNNLLELTENMKLVVIYYEKNEIREMPVLSQDIKFNMWQYLNDNAQNKRVINMIYNFLKNKTDYDLTPLKNADEGFSLSKFVSNLPYILQRKLYFYLYEK